MRISLLFVVMTGVGVVLGCFEATDDSTSKERHGTTRPVSQEHESERVADRTSDATKVALPSGKTRPAPSSSEAAPRQQRSSAIADSDMTGPVKNDAVVAVQLRSSKNTPQTISDPNGSVVEQPRVQQSEAPKDENSYRPESTRRTISGKVLNPTGYQEQQFEGFIHCFVDGRGTKWPINNDGKFTIEHPAAVSRFSLLLTSPLTEYIVVSDAVSIDGPIVFRWQLTEDTPADQQQRNLDAAKNVVPTDQTELLEQIEKRKQQLFFRQRHHAMRLIIPAYFPPTETVAWNRLFKFVEAVQDNTEVHVVLDVGNGSGVYDPVNRKSLALDKAMVLHVAELQSKGISWLGYMTLRRARDSDYRRYPWRKDFDGWRSRYPGMSGIFLTEISHTLPTSNKLSMDVRKFLNTCKQTLAKDVNSPVLVANAGRYCDRSYAELPPVNWICVNETPYQDAVFRRPAWADIVAHVRFGTFIYDAPSTQEVLQSFKLAMSQGADFCFVSHNDPGNVPWQNFLKPEAAEAVANLVRSWNATATLP